MKIISDRYTSRVRGEDGKYVYLPPGTVIDLPAAAARERIKAGRAEIADTDSSAVERSDDESAGVGDLEAVQDAILNLDEDPELYLKDGRPKTEPLSEALGRAVSAAERDEAWTALQAE